MTDTQKKMAEYPETRTVTWVDDQTGQKVGECEYVRLDLAQAMVAAAYENAAPHRKNPVDVSDCSKQTYFDAMPSIEVDVDAWPHMDAMLTEAHEEGKAEGLKEAAAIVSQVIQAYAMMKPGKPDQYASREAQIVAKGFARLIEEEILALIPTVKDA